MVLRPRASLLRVDLRLSTTLCQTRHSCVDVKILPSSRIASDGTSPPRDTRDSRAAPYRTRVRRCDLDQDAPSSSAWSVLAARRPILSHPGYDGYLPPWDIERLAMPGPMDREHER